MKRSKIKITYPDNIRELHQKVQISYYKSKIYESDKVFSAIWDTGATSTVISQNTAKKLNLKPIDVTYMMTANGTVSCNVYMIKVLIDRKIAKIVRATEAKLGEIDMLLGMDIIGDGEFLVKRLRSGELALSYISRA